MIIVICKDKAAKKNMLKYLLKNVAITQRTYDRINKSNDLFTTKHSLCFSFEIHNNVNLLDLIKVTRLPYKLFRNIRHGIKNRQYSNRYDIFFKDDMFYTFYDFLMATKCNHWNFVYHLNF